MLCLLHRELTLPSVSGTDRENSQEKASQLPEHKKPEHIPIMCLPALLFYAGYSARTFQVRGGGLSVKAIRFFNPTQRPSQPAQFYDLLLLSSFKTLLTMGRIALSRRVNILGAGLMVDNWLFACPPKVNLLPELTAAP